MVRTSAVLTLRAYLAAMIGNSAGPRPDEAMGLLYLLDRWLVAVVSRVRCGR
jgi:hypothetical protein